MTDVVRNAKLEGLTIIIGGDMNAHIWELDICENKNGKFLKSMVDSELYMGEYERCYMVFRRNTSLLWIIERRSKTGSWYGVTST